MGFIKFIFLWNILAVTCQPLRVPVNGRIRPVSCSSGATYKQTCTFICNDGYDIRGKKQIRCLADRTWSDSVPSCDRGILHLCIFIYLFCCMTMLD